MTGFTQEKLKKALDKKGTNLCAWARNHEYPYTTVHTVVGRWAGRSDRTPHGGLARKIMGELATFVANIEKN